MDIPKVGFGTYQIKDQSVFEDAINCGYSYFDTAELYKNEQILKQALDKCCYKNVFVTTKISKKSILNGEIKKSFNERLEIFGKIDLILLHHPTDNCKKDWEELSELYKKHQDRVRYIGVSNYDVKHLEEIKDCKIKPYCNQIELSPFYTREDLVNYMDVNDIKIVAHTSLTRGNKLNDSRLVKIANNNFSDPSEILLLWALYKGYTIIPRSSNLNHIVQNLYVSSYVKNFLSSETIDLLDSLNENYLLTKVNNEKTET